MGRKILKKDDVKRGNKITEIKIKKESKKKVKSRKM